MTTYRHHKGGLYELLYYAKEESTRRDMVVYRSTSGGHVWCRPLDEWVGHVRKETGEEVKRFTRLEDVP